MTRPAADEARPDFSLVLGGPLFQLFRRAHLSGDALEQYGSLRVGEAAQRNGGQRGMETPGRVKLGTEGEHQQQPCRWDLVDEEAKQLQGRGVHPLHIFDDEEHGLPRRLGEEPCQQRFQGFGLLALRCEHERRIMLRERERELQERATRLRELGAG